MPCDPDVISVYLVPTEDASLHVKATCAKMTLVTDDGVVFTGYQGTVLTQFANEVTGRVSHFATCPAASRFRR